MSMSVCTFQLKTGQIFHKILYECSTIGGYPKHVFFYFAVGNKQAHKFVRLE